jgi:hypothetical protein
MLLEAGFVALFFAPPGLRPGLVSTRPTSRAALFLLIWEWFRIYFESGVAKMMGGDPEWRNFTAMDDYYQNGPLPTWIGWYAAHLPLWFHATTVALTLGLELFLIWAVFLPRRFRLILFFIVTPWQLGIILTANYTFLNYLVLILGFLLLDDLVLVRFFPARWKALLPEQTPAPGPAPIPPAVDSQSILSATSQKMEASTGGASSTAVGPPRDVWETLQTWLAPARVAFNAVLLLWLFYATTAQMVWMVTPLSLPTTPVALLEPFRIANRYGLFAVMTRGRYEIEFQGSNDGQTWIAYPFRHKPQDIDKPPRIYAPYQPRLDWNLWFASLGEWRDNPMVLRTERHLLSNDADVLSLFGKSDRRLDRPSCYALLCARRAAALFVFAANPFPQSPPRQVRAVLWQYWFTSMQEKRATGAWWRRQFVGFYAPTIELAPGGKIAVTQWPEPMPPHE